MPQIADSRDFPLKQSFALIYKRALQTNWVNWVETSPSNTLDLPFSCHNITEKFLQKYIVIVEMYNSGETKTAALMLPNCNASLQNENCFQNFNVFIILSKSNWKIDPKFELWTMA